VRLETLPVEEGFARTSNTTGYAGGFLFAKRAILRGAMTLTERAY